MIHQPAMPVFLQSIAELLAAGGKPHAVAVRRNHGVRIETTKRRREWVIYIRRDRCVYMATILTSSLTSSLFLSTAERDQHQHPGGDVCDGHGPPHTQNGCDNRRCCRSSPRQARYPGKLSINLNLLSNNVPVVWSCDNGAPVEHLLIIASFYVIYAI